MLFELVRQPDHSADLFFGCDGQDVDDVHALAGARCFGDLVTFDTVCFAGRGEEQDGIMR